MDALWRIWLIRWGWGCELEVGSVSVAYVCIIRLCDELHVGNTVGYDIVMYIAGVMIDDCEINE